MCVAVCMQCVCAALYSNTAFCKPQRRVRDARPRWDENMTEGLRTLIQLRHYKSGDNSLTNFSGSCLNSVRLAHVLGFTFTASFISL